MAVVVSKAGGKCFSPLLDLLCLALPHSERWRVMNLGAKDTYTLS